MIPASFTRRGFPPEEDPSQEFPRGSGLSVLDDLRREIAIGIEEADRGELAPFDPLATLERIRSRPEAKAAQS
jgi:hypothetical protein